MRDMATPPKSETRHGSDVVLDVSEAAALLRVSTKTLTKLAREHRIPGRKVGREWRFSSDALVRYLAGSAE
jgi:excisionase family DNA binding protein